MLGNFFKRLAPTHFAERYQQKLDGTFNLYEARRGRGKSYAMAAWARVAVRNNRPVLANFWLSHDFLAYEHLKAGHSKNLSDAMLWCQLNVRQVSAWDEVIIAYDCLILLDEANRLFDMTDTSKDVKAPRVVFEWLQQSRKHDNTLVFAAQSMDWLTPRVRQLFDRLWRAKKEMGKKGQITRFYAYGSDPWAKGLGASAVRDADFLMSLPFDERIYRLYRTKEIIAAFEPKSRFERFYDVEAYMIEHGLKPKVPLPRPRLDLPEWWEDRTTRTTRSVSDEEDEEDVPTISDRVLALFGPPLPADPLPPVRGAESLL